MIEQLPSASALTANASPVTLPAALLFAMFSSFPSSLQMKVDALSGTVKQHTEDCFTDNRSMLDLSEAGLVGADSASSDISSLTSQIALLASGLAAANGVRGKETKDFSKSEVELTEVLHTLKHVIFPLAEENQRWCREQRRCSSHCSC